MDKLSNRVYIFDHVAYPNKQFSLLINRQRVIYICRKALQLEIKQNNYAMILVKKND